MLILFMLPLRLTLLIICISEFMDNSLSEWSVFIVYDWWSLPFNYTHKSNISEFIDYTDLFTHAHTERVRERNRYAYMFRRGRPNITTFLCVHKTHQKSQMLNVNQLFYRIEKFLLLSLFVDDVVVVVIMFSSHSWPERNFFRLSNFSLSWLRVCLFLGFEQMNKKSIKKINELGQQFM